MRVRLYIPQRLNDLTNGAGLAFVSEVRAALEQRQDTQIVDGDADIVHLFGSWNGEVDRIARRCHRLAIPTVYSTLGGLAPWFIASHNLHQRATQRRTAGAASVIQVWGPEERAELKRRKWNGNVSEIKNPATSVGFSRDALGQALAGLYQETAIAHDTYIKKGIEQRVNEAMAEAGADAKELCRKLLYAQYYHRRGTLPKQVLNDIALTMLRANYDEEAFIEDLKTLDLLKFTVRLEKLMAEKAGLTEGFMPIEAVDDKKTDELRKTIKDYELPHQ